MIGNKIRALLVLTNNSTKDVCEKLNILNVAFYRKLSKNTFKAEELIKLADLTDTTLAFIDRNGKPMVVFDMDDIKEPAQTD